MTHQDITNLLRREMVPALGCTGPTAYALAGARCRPYLTAEVESIDVYVCPEQLKIGFGVATPGTSEPGIGIAAAMGVLGGDYERGFGVLETTDSSHVEKALSMVNQGQVKIFCDWDQTYDIYVREEVKTANESVTTVVAGTYDRVVSVSKDGREIFRIDVPEISGSDIHLTPDLIFDYIDQVDTAELKFLLDGYHLNYTLAEDGLKNNYGLQAGRSYLTSIFSHNNLPEDLFEDPMKYLPSNLIERSKILVAAASDARMGGSRHAAMAAMGDGNQGITAIIPVGLAAEAVEASEQTMIRALALSCLLTFYVKLNIGRTSAFCMCGMAASTGVAGAVSYLRGMDEQKIRAAAKNTIATLAGVLCDGAKNSCALKMAISVVSAIGASDLAKLGSEVGYYDGVAAAGLEETVDCVADIAKSSKESLDTSMVQNILRKERNYRLKGENNDKLLSRHDTN